MSVNTIFSKAGMITISSIDTMRKGKQGNSQLFYCKLP